MKRGTIKTNYKANSIIFLFICYVLGAFELAEKCERERVRLPLLIIV